MRRREFERVLKDLLMVSVESESTNNGAYPSSRRESFGLTTAYYGGASQAVIQSTDSAETIKKGDWQMQHSSVTSLPRVGS